MCAISPATSLRSSRRRSRPSSSAAGFIGLPADDCPKFVKGLVKSCHALVKVPHEVQRRRQRDRRAQRGEDVETSACDAQPTKDERKSCQSTVKTTTKENQAVSSQTVNLLGVNACNGGFAADMLELCLEGTIEP